MKRLGLILLNLFLITSPVCVFGQLSSNVKDAGDRYEIQSSEIKSVIDENKKFNRNYYYGLQRQLEFTIDGVESVAKLSVVKQWVETEFKVFSFEVISETNVIVMNTSGDFTISDLKTILVRNGFQLGKLNRYFLVLSK